MKTVSFVGGGPTAIYTVHALLHKAQRPFSLTIFEDQASLGRGTPYRPGWNDPAMLSNIASIEIPPINQTLVEWLHGLSESELARLRVDPSKIGERTFYPRLVLGEYFHSQVSLILADAQAKGIDIHVRTRCRVQDAVSRPDGMILTVRSRKGDVSRECFDHVVIATGHQWPATPEARPGYFLCPWPASVLANIPPSEVGIRGTSLTAIDATVALASAHGEFADGAGDRLVYHPKPGTDAFHMTMMSRKGLLPEADFYAPLPYEPLSICTPEAIEKLIAEDNGQLLEESFELFKRELQEADPDYSRKLGLGGPRTGRIPR